MDLRGEEGCRPPERLEATVGLTFGLVEAARIVAAVELLRLNETNAQPANLVLAARSFLARELA